MTNQISTANLALNLIIGDPVSHSLSPMMHNAGYRALEIPFLMTAACVKASNLEHAIKGVRALGINALSVTMPHKVAILSLLDNLDPTAEKIGAVNTVVNDNGRLLGFNTDWLGILRPLESRIDLQGKRVAILGAGGAAQAAIFATQRSGAQVRLFNRSLDKALELSTRWQCEAYPLSETKKIYECDVLINTTSVGMGDLSSETPVAGHSIHADQIVFETIYAPRTTRLLHEAAQSGATLIKGIEMFLEQGVAQFELQTGSKAPRQAMLTALSDHMDGAKSS
jgi:shikimate dehydrogenase